jgi:YD repeat-containing protein
MHKKIITLALTLICTAVFSQTEKPKQSDTQKIIPLSPNTAAFARYGEIPVSNFTGTINLTVPIYTIKTKEFTLPIELSYHSGGNRVESIASNVGLGWSLGTIPVISRSVNGIPDEYGFFTKYLGLSAKELYFLDYNDLRNIRYVDALANGEADSEPDIFSFNILGKSGKFIFDQEHDKFVTLEESQIKITFHDGYFTLISEDGYEYTFFQRETTSSNNQQTVTAWYVAEITSPSKNEKITFHYSPEPQTSFTLSPITKVLPTGVGLDVNTDIVTKVPITTITSILSQRLEKITFNSGVVEFNKNTTGRLDLQGGFDLNNIVIKDLANKEIFKYVLQYKYLTGSSCYGNEAFSNKWMLLEKVKNISSLTNPNEYSFTYNEAAIPPCRNSPAQDYWGYYNGAKSNVDLIPTTFYKNLQISGADRTVNPTESQFAILKKVTYPTGGYSEFDYENNTTSLSVRNLPGSYKKEWLSLEGAGPYGDADEYEEFSDTITINNPPEPFLNGLNPSGGAYADFAMECYGCNLIDKQADAIINFKLIKEATPTSPSKIIYISTKEKGYYLENGTYKLKAYIGVSPSPRPKIEGFYVAVNWNIIDPNPNSNKYIGGLRVSEIRSFPAASQKPITKKYKYTLEYNSELSSGIAFSDPTFVFEDDINIGNGDCSNSHCSGLYHRIKSYNNIQQITHSGSVIGYISVFEESDMPDKTGVTHYLYTHSTDKVNPNFPFPPSLSMELFRGQPKEIWYYKKNSVGELILIEGKEFEYGIPSKLGQEDLYVTVTGIKIGRYSFLGGGGNSSFYNSYFQAQYSISTNKNLLMDEITTKYFDTGNVTTSKKYYYDNVKHLKLTSETATNSTQGTQETKYFYPDDTEMAAKPFRNDLVVANRIATPLVTKSLVDGTKIAEQETEYKNDLTTGNLLLPKFIYSNKGTDVIDPAKDRKITYDFYDNKGNILQYTPEKGVPVSIIWGYNQTQPIAKVENATNAQITALLGITNLKDVNETNLTAINNLRNTLPNAMVSTYTYKPLVGVTTITDPKGDIITYIYDALGRLETVKDKNGDILSQNQYKYKQ